MSRHFHIWRDKQTIQGLWPNCIWRDKQNQEKNLALEPKTRKPKCILHKISLLDFFQTYTSRHVACVSFCIWNHYCADAKLCAIAVSLPFTANLFLITKQPRDKNSEPCQQILHGFEMNVVSTIIAGQGPLWQVFRLKAPSARTQKVILNKILYYICESWYEPFEKYASQSPGWFKNLWTMRTL